jgi:argininosuccinate lyase
MTLWGGCFEGTTNELVRRFGDSLRFDRRLAAVDVRGSIAHVQALTAAGVLDAEDARQLVAGLGDIANEIEADDFDFGDDEDIHSAVERRLTERIGSVAGKLHTGRSRNDQVATDLRLYVLEAIGRLREELVALQRSILRKAAAHVTAVMPGYTHLQPAQPVLFSHWLMSFFWKLDRDAQRLSELRGRVDVCPLGVGALAGSPYPIDRDALAASLGFSAAAQNGIDAVEDRDFVVECLTWAALLQVHLSSLAETLIVWSSESVGFVRLPDAYSTGSSLMPQKRNPDILELMRGKAGRLIGHATAFLCALKGLPSGYNKDLQEDKEGLFDAIDTVELELQLAAGLIESVEIDEARMEAACDDGLMATDLADDLVGKGVSFRESHHLVGQAVRRAHDLGVPLHRMRLEEYQAIDLRFNEELYSIFDPRRSVALRGVKGGTAPSAVAAQIKVAHDRLVADGP